MNQASIDSMRKIWNKLGITTAPSFHVVLGSGFGAALESAAVHDWKHLGEISFPEIPGLVSSTVPDHAGKYSYYQHASGRTVCFQMGRLHGYEGHEPQEVVQTVMIPRLAGTKNFILTNAAGGLKLEYGAGEVMLIRDHVNLTGKNPLVGPNAKDPSGKEIGERFPDLSALYEQEWLDKIQSFLKQEKLKTHNGIYLGLMGPSFETPAEVRLFGSWGLGAVGMSTVWEAIALKHSGARLAGLSLISNLGAGLIPNTTLHHEQIIETCRASAEKIVRSVLKFVSDAEGI